MGSSGDLPELAARLNEILVGVRAVLKSGNYAILQDLSRQQEALELELADVSRLSDPNNTELLSQIAEAAARNERLLKAALAGIRSARPGRGSDAISASTTTYDRRGQQRRLESETRKLELRR
jgi:hypothetical protein